MPTTAAPWCYRAALDAERAEFDGELKAWIAPQITDDQPSFGSSGPPSDRTERCR